MKIALLCPDDFTVWHFYRGLINALRYNNHDVYVISSAGEYAGKIENLGARHIPLEINRFINPWGDVKLIFKLCGIFRKYRFDVVHNFFLKLNFYGSLAARLSGVNKVYGTVEGLGYSYTQIEKGGLRFHKFVMDRICQFGCSLTDKIWFVNRDDLAYFVSNKIASSQKCLFIKSHGINTREYSSESADKQKVQKVRAELDLGPQSQVVTMVVARVIWSKGIKVFLEASKMMGEKYPGIKFLLVGPIEAGNPDSVPEDYLLNNKHRNFVWFSDFRNDIREIISVSDIVVLPSYYREGIPTVLLEAMAMSKPIVTTDSVGCRELVKEGENGFLVPVNDSRSLAAAIEKLATDENRRAEFGRYSRRIAEEEFSEEKIINRLIRELYCFN